MNFFKFNKDKAITALKLLLKNGEQDIHKLFKIVYFADQKYLSAYGTTISGDKYIAMKNGPVPSNLYDLVKLIRGDNKLSFFQTENAVESELKSCFEFVDNYKLKLINNKFNYDVLSSSELCALRDSYSENVELSFSELTEKSHGSAWKASNQNNEISIIEIAKEAKVDEGFLKYILLNIENENLIL